MDIKAGSTIRFEIVKRPANEAARKTLERICRKDAGVAKAVRRRKENRPSLQEWRRGGRYWHHQMRSHAPIKLEPGSTYTVQTTVPMVRDLASVARWIKVQPA